MALPLVPLAILALAAVAAGAKGSGSGGGGRQPIDLQESANDNRQWIQFLGQEAGLTDEWIIFWEATAAGESGFSNYIARGTTHGAPDWVKVNSDSGDVSGAKRAFDRNDYLRGCGHPESQYTFGGAGLWQMFPANAVAAFKGTDYECIDPWYIFDLAPQYAMAIEYARRIMRWDAFKANPTWLNLRVGWGSPTSMNKRASLDRMRNDPRKFGDRLEEIGYPRSFMDRQVDPLPPKDPVGLTDYLATLV